MHSFDRKVLFGFVGALTVFLVVGIFSYFKTQDFMATSRQSVQIHLVLENLEGILRDISEAKGSQRDFIITGKPAFLQACQNSVFSIDEKVKNIRKLIREGAGEQAKLEQLNPLLVQEIDFFKKTIAARRDGGFEQALQLIQGAQSMETMDKIHQLVADVLAEEMKLSDYQAVLMQKNPPKFLTLSGRVSWRIPSCS